MNPLLRRRGAGLKTGHYTGEEDGWQDARIEEGSLAAKTALGMTAFFFAEESRGQGSSIGCLPRDIWLFGNHGWKDVGLETGDQAKQRGKKNAVPEAAV